MYTGSSTLSQPRDSCTRAIRCMMAKRGRGARSFSGTKLDRVMSQKYCAQCSKRLRWCSNQKPHPVLALAQRRLDLARQLLPLQAGAASVCFTFEPRFGSMQALHDERLALIWRCVVWDRVKKKSKIEESMRSSVRLRNSSGEKLERLFFLLQVSKPGYT